MVLTEFFWQERNTLQASQAKFTTPEELLFPTKALDELYLRVLFALKERDVEQLISPSTWGIVESNGCTRCLEKGQFQKQQHKICVSVCKGCCESEEGRERKSGDHLQ